ncbi:hypothetical protein AVEN_195865-1 [Araneus ventricosus]|uniref:Uncharacterized protein n=1 Tax=Araneus ventricosus TaxID=182803 RepID=A0A4Y2DXD2_ARAVE|nr:hypothetical protein AVEN_195865-1 [Araneus ventricosus]
MESSSTFKHNFSPNGNIEKIPAPLRSHISSPNLSPSSQDGRQVCHQGQGTRRGCASHPILTPVKLSSQPQDSHCWEATFHVCNNTYHQIHYLLGLT